MPVLLVASSRAPTQDLAADVTRWAKTAKGSVKRPRASLTAWLKRFGDQDRPIDPRSHPLAAEVAAAEALWHRERTPEALDNLRRVRGMV